ncbi:uncharacterized protein LOC131578394 isoform X2 [Poecile atricapillus]|uniref:uncharacterized protein LOC131578394 isoform X2 n=1 Tax=Poecile atricapillus TaxID=48891 RepID=UPI002738DBC4|nr:uncharacterized protein LOC131578394 isoform X2 [Poecile atricapillus]XP_058692995.1 uncharacterized protein LOC131578394 isoform X2 [Poecile atricapillus]
MALRKISYLPHLPAWEQQTFLLCGRKPLADLYLLNNKRVKNICFQTDPPELSRESALQTHPPSQEFCLSYLLLFSSLETISIPLLACPSHLCIPPSPSSVPETLGLVLGQFKGCWKGSVEFCWDGQGRGHARRGKDLGQEVTGVPRAWIKDNPSTARSLLEHQQPSPPLAHMKPRARFVSRRHLDKKLWLDSGWDNIHNPYLDSALGKSCNSPAALEPRNFCCTHVHLCWDTTLDCVIEG